MNIVKIKDVFIEDNDIFNEYYKGKYCYVINWVWLLPLSIIDNYEYIELSKSNTNNPSEDILVPSEWDEELKIKIQETCLLFDDQTSYIDEPETIKSNSVSKFLLANEIAISGDLTIDQIKQFRTWLAATLYDNQELYQGYTKDVEKTTQMLNYYRMNMYDDVCKAMFNFANIPVIQANLSAASCYSGCMPTAVAAVQSCSCGGTNINTVGGIISGCLDTYRKNVYNWMVIVFSDSSFWNLFNETDPNLIDLIIKYIQAILDANLPLSKQCDKITYNDCSCLTSGTDMANRKILEDTIKAFGFIRNNETAANQTFIYNSLNKWASALYEIMQW